MFDLPRAAAEAKRAHKLENIYHKGQELSWDGKAVLQGLLDKHGGIDIPPEKRDAICRIFAVILWGELAAWRISAQLADRLVPLEAKMAATSQAHDEARHFYVMYDYLAALGDVPRQVTRPTEKVLGLVLNAKPLLHKMIGMQLLVEPIALAIFQLVRTAEVDPVLTDLVRYYERDEARHVGLGVQHLPELINKSNRIDGVRAIAFQLRIIAWTIRGLQEFEDDFAALGISSREVVTVARGKLFTASELLWRGVDIKPMARKELELALEAGCEVLFPRPEVGKKLGSRMNAAREVWRAGGLGTELSELAPSS